MDQSKEIEKENEVKPQRPLNPWLVHVKKMAAEFPDLTYKEILRKARETYTKVEKPVKKREYKKIKPKPKPLSDDEISE